MAEMAERLKTAVLGATGSVGQRFVQLLENHPLFELNEVVGSERSAGKSYAEAVDWRLSADVPQSARELTVKHPEQPIESQLVFASLPGGLARETELRLAADGHYVFSNAKDNRLEEDIPLIIPEVNPGHAAAIERQQQERGFSEGFVVTNPNCSTIHLVLSLKPLFDEFGIEQCFVSTMQAASGAGYPGVPSLDLIDNVVPYISREEEAMETETRKLLGDWDGNFSFADIELSAQCNRVPVRDAHTETVNLKLKKKASPEEVIEVLRAFRGKPQELGLPSAPEAPVIVRDEQDRPQPILDREVSRGMASVVGRVRRCNILDIRYVVLGHNTIRGAAGASVLNAEMLHAEGYVR